MLDGMFVIDAVAHGLHFAPENQAAADQHPDVGLQEYERVHLRFAPTSRPEYVLDRERWLRGADPELLAHALFAESATDFAIYHGVPQYGVFKDGGSPLWVGAEMRRRWPHRVALYGPINPWRPDVLEEVDRLVDEEGVIGLKLYPVDLDQGRIVSFRMDDATLLYPIYERARARGIRSIAVHKAIPLRTFPSAPYRVDDVEEPAAAFPDLLFEVVHGGAAFLEETAMLLSRFPNVVVNLEATSAILNVAPARFAQILGTLVSQWHGADRVFWGTGVSAVHPQPLLEAFRDLEMPRHLVEGFGMPELTPELKAKILGENCAKALGLDVSALRAAQANDEFAALDGLAPPWSDAAAVA